LTSGHARRRRLPGMSLIALHALLAGYAPYALAATVDGVYVVDENSDEPYGYAVVVINLTTGRVYAPITVGGYPTAVAITA